MRKAFASCLVLAALAGAVQATNLHEPQTAAVEVVNITLPTTPPTTTAPMRHAIAPDSAPRGLDGWSFEWRNAKPSLR